MARITHQNLVHIDIETRSFVDLNERGVYLYADPNFTDILFVNWAVGDSDIFNWIPWLEPCPQELLNLMLNSNFFFAAHNAQFERLIFNNVSTVKYDTPVVPLERWFCTMYQAAVNNLPASLADAGRALHTKAQKDERGKFLIRTLSKPCDDEGNFDETPELLTEFNDYCRQDVETERNISLICRMPSDNEMLDYWASEVVNDRGVKIDRALARKAVGLADAIAEDAEEQITKLTDGAVLKPRGAKLTAWVFNRMDEKGQRMMTKQVKDGDTGKFTNKTTLDRNARELLMDYEGLTGLSREVVELAESVGSGSVAKFNAMLKGVQADDRVRGSYICSGAPATGRYSARRLQLHNFSRDTYKNPEPVIQKFIETGELPDSPMLAMKRLLRPALMAEEGKTFVCSDWSAIEGRALPWLTLDSRCEEKLEIFRRNECVYLATASDIYREKITEKKDPRRQVGKVAELALGYQGAAGSFLVMGANYGVDLPAHEVNKIVHDWRKVNPGIVAFWYDLEKQAMKAVDKPGTVFESGRVSFYFHEHLCGGTLWIKLPSDRLLSYTDCRLEWDSKWEKYSLTSLNATVKPKAGAKEWTRRGLYGGLLAENITQAACGDLLRETIRALVADDFPVVAHTHDETMLEVNTAQADEYLEMLEEYMLFVPEWATGLPLAVESWIGPRYRK